MKTSPGASRGAMIFALALLVFVFSASVAFAATFSQQRPAVNAVVAASPAVVSVALADAVPLVGTVTAKIDGQVKASTMSYVVVAGHWEFDEESEESYWVWAGTDYTHAVLSMNPGALADGQHAVSVSMDGANGSTPFTYSWTFVVAKPKPTFSAATPAADAGLTTSPQKVSVAMASATPLLGEFIMTLNGAPKPATVVYAYSGGVYDYTHATVKCPPGALADGPQTATVTFTPSNGDASTSFSWTFNLAEKPTLGVVSPTAGSTVSTVRPAITLGATDNGTIASTSVTVDGAVVPSAYDAVAQVVRGTLPGDLTNLSSHAVTATVTDAGGNSSTKSWSFSTAEPVTSFSGAYPQAGTMLAAAITTVQVDVACSVSIADNFVTHPLTKVTVDGVAYPWDLSHPAGDPTRATIRCYPPASVSTDGQHTIAVTVGNALGTTSTKTWQVGVGIAPTLGVPTPAPGTLVTTLTPVIEVPASDNSAVTSWTASVDGVVVPATYGAGSIHVAPPAGLQDDATTVVSVTVRDATGLTGNLTWNLAVQVNPEMLNKVDDCRMCHADPHGFETACDECHTPGTANQIPYPHAGAPSGFHAAADVSACRPCHVSSITVEHARRSVSCESCHQSSDSAVVAAIAANDTRCASCHSHADHESLHLTTVAPGCTGDSCHSGTSLTSIHIKPDANPDTKLTCDSCHKSSNPLVVSAIDGGNRSCTACHGSDKHRGLHDVTVIPACSGTGCHAANNLTAIHAAGGCDTCHESADAGVIAAIAGGEKDCDACHAPQPHPGLEAKHTATMSNGVLTVFDDHEGIGAVNWEVQCSMCHATTQLLTIHAGDCAACHGGTRPVGSFTTWNKSCQQGACHPTIAHERGTDAHNSYVNNDCETCHESDWSVYYGTCEWCHDPASTTAPSTSSDIKANYVGSAPITFSAPGVHYTLHKVDGGAISRGNALTIPGPAVGSASHSVEYWSVDDAGNEELPHKTAMFAIAADTVGPTTSSNAVANYVGPAAITLSVTDNNSVPTTRTFWKLDGGAPSAGRLICVPQPPSGTQSHTIEFWSVDAAGIEELPHKTRTFNIVADIVAPTTTSNAPLYDRTTYSLLVTFACSDPDPSSGIATTYCRLDNGTAFARWWMYLPYTQGSHTIQYWSVDGAGNVEAAKTQTVIKDWTPPTTTSNAGASYVGSAAIHLTALDSGPAGIQATYYQLDSQPQVTGTDVTTSLTGPHTLKFWSADKAGNVEAQKTVSFTVTGGTVDTTPPTTVSDAVSEYLGTASIHLTASDDGGTGVAHTHYRLDGGAETVGTVVTVPGPPSGSVAHTLEFWSVDNANNVETAKQVSFTSTYGGTGTITLMWDAPDGSSAYYSIYDADGNLVASAPSGSLPGWYGYYTATVPVDPRPYHWEAAWYDSDYGEEGTTEGNALIDTAGTAYSSWY